MSKTVNVDLGYRKQWIGIEGAPQSLYATVHSEIRFDKRNKVLNEFNNDGDLIYSTPINSVGINKHVVGDGRWLIQADRSEKVVVWVGMLIILGSKKKRW